MINKIIEKINNLSNNVVFIKNDIIEGYQYIINNFSNVEYYDYGGSVICFISNNKIIKLCKKDTNTLSNFKYYINILSKHDLIAKSNIIFENNTCIVYEQEFVNQIYVITNKVVKDILELFQKFVEINIISTDNFYKNFGYINHKLVLFDIHDFIELNNIKDNNELNVLGFAQTFYYLFHDNNRSVGLQKTIEEIIESNYCAGLFPNDYCNFLKNIYNKKYDNNIKISCSKEYNDYQYINIDDKGYMTLENHTLLKYNLTTDFKNFKTVLDAGCSLGGIGLKIAYENQNSFITLNNMTDNELNIAREISANCTIFNVNFDDQNLVNLNQQYDLTLYFAILHHIIKSVGLEQTLELIKNQTKKYSIIEIPLKGDALLDRLFNGSVQGTQTQTCCNYKDIDVLPEGPPSALSSVDTFKECLTKNNFEILDFGKIDYPNSPDLNRYYFKLKKLNF